MKKIFLTIFLTFLFSIDGFVSSKAVAIDLGIEIAVKGKKLKEFFLDNVLLLSFEEKILKEYRFQQKKYEVFEDGKLVESGKWKISGLLKNEIRLKAENKKKSYYFKKINKKPIIYHYNNLPSATDVIKTFVAIESSSKFKEITENNEQIEQEEPKVTAEKKITIDENDSSSKKKDKKTSVFKKITAATSLGLKKVVKEATKEMKTASTQSSSNTQQSASTLSQSINENKLKLYNASSLTTFYFFDASHNFMSSLELLYRAYDQNTEADKLAAQITYLKESKSNEAQRLKSTKQIVDVASVEIAANINDASLVLSDMGRGYYEQSLPYAFSAVQSAYSLFIVVKNTKDNVKSSEDLVTGLLNNLSEVVGIATILPEIPQFTKNMITTSKLIFNGARSRKIKDKGNYGKSLDELSLDF